MPPETAAVATPPAITPSPQAVPDVPLQNRRPVSNKILNAARAVREQAQQLANEKKQKEDQRRNPPQTPPNDAASPAEPKAPEGTNSAEASTPDGGIKPPLAGDKEANLANLRKLHEQATARATELERQLAEIQARIPQDYEQLRKDRELLIAEIEKRDVTASPRFKEKYDKPMEQQLGQIKKTLSLTDVKPDDFLVVVQMPESKERNTKLGELMEGLDRVSAGKIETALSQYDAIRDQRTQDISDPKTAWQENQREIQERQRKATEAQKAHIESAITKAKTSIPWFKPIEGNEPWNARLAETEKRARDFWTGGHSPEELAELTVAGTLAPLQAETIVLLAAENEKLNEELAGYRGAKPKNQAGSSSSVTTAGKGKYEGFGNLGAMVRAKAMERGK